LCRSCHLDNTRKIKSSSAPALAGFRFTIETKNRMPDITGFYKAKGWLEFVIKPIQKLKVCLYIDDTALASIPIEKF